MKSLKTFLAESPNLNTIPSKYAYSANPHELSASDPDDPAPIIDFSLLTSDDPFIRSQAVQELDKACTDWGFFQLINHGVPESLMKILIEKSLEFFDLEEEEKKEFEEKDYTDGIRYGSGFNHNKDKGFVWRDYLKLFLYPDFHCPNKPLGYSEVFFEYSKRTREVSRELLRAISTILGLDDAYVVKALDLDDGLQVCGVNLFPPCPQPELAIGLPPHSDHGLFTFLINNGVPGFQIKPKDKWIKIHNTLPGSILVNTGDQLEIFTNGKYKSLEHRAALNIEGTKVSIVIVNGPSLNAVVAPADKLVDEKRSPAAYVPMKYKDYIGMQQREQLVQKTALERVRA